MERKEVAISQHGAMIPLQDVERMAIAFAKSGLFGIKTPEQGVALMLIAQAEGLHPAVAARDYNVIQGRPALKADAMLARFQQAGGKVVWNAYTDTAVSGTFSHSQGGSATVEWTIAQAKGAGLTSKDVWRQYPRAMLRARVISEGIRTVYPGVSVGVYTPEEIEDFDSKPAKEVREFKAEVQSVPVQGHTVEPVVEAPKPAPKPAIPAAKPVSPMRKEAMAKLKESKWTKEEFVQYCTMVFGIASSAHLADEALATLANVAQGPFQLALDEGLALAFAQGELTVSDDGML